MNENPVVFDIDGHPVNPQMLLEAYVQRCFPMSEDRDGPLAWYRPPERAVIDWQSWKIPKSLQKIWKKNPYRMSFDTAFSEVMQACAERETTWIGKDIETLYTALHHKGIAHSVEAWDEDDQLVGGLYGLALGGAFCGESMFRRADNASKLSVIYLVEHLQRQGFLLLDCQQQTPHMQRFGAYIINDDDYQAIFEQALAQDVHF